MNITFRDSMIYKTLSNNKAIAKQTQLSLSVGLVVSVYLIFFIIYFLPLQTEDMPFFVAKTSF